MSMTRKPARALSLALSLCALIAGAGASAQAERLPVRSYTSADGLGSNFINYLMRDSHGFLWFCTRDGLSRFDGSRFVTYQVGNQNSPPGIERIFETRKGIYWIVTTGGLYRYDPNAPLAADKTSNTDRPVLNAARVSDDRASLYEDREGRLWVGGTALSLLEEKDGRISEHAVELNLPADLFSRLHIATICEGQDGSLWLATSVGFIRRLPDGREILYSSDSGKGTFSGISVLEDSTGHIWAGRTTGVYLIKPEPIEQLSQLSALTIRDLDALAQVRPRDQAGLPEQPGEVFMYTDLEGFTPSVAKFLYMTSDAHVWISGGDGVIEFDGQRFIAHTTAQGVQSGVGLMVEDTGGNLWLGWTTGLMRLNRHGISTYDADDGLKNFQILAIRETVDGHLYVGDDHYSLSLFDGKSFQTIHPQIAPDARAAWTSNAAFQDHTGEWWFLTNGKLYHFAAVENFKALASARPLAVYTMGDGLSGSMMFHIFEDSKGNVWLSTRGEAGGRNGLSVWDRAAQKFHLLSEADGFRTDKAVSSFAEDRNGNLWLGFYQGGLARYAPGRYKEFTTADGLPSGVITALYLDGRGGLWIASSDNGLSRIDDTTTDHPRFINYSTSNGLSSNNVRSITADLYGNIYAGTARGVDRLSPDGKHLQHYSVRDGLVGDFVSIAFRDRSGAIWFGTPNGLSRLVPEPQQQASAPPVRLGALRIAGESHPLPELGSTEIDALELSHTQNNLQIEFFGIDFNTGGALRYQYILEGADKDWSQPTEQQTVTYANLAPGSYRFLVRAINSDGVASSQPASISFRVLSPIWLRWWFLTLLALVIATLIYMIFRYRLARAIELERVRTRIATDLHDDIGSSLSQIAILSEVVNQRVGRDNSPVVQPLSMIAGTSREMVDAMSDIVWAINPKQDHLSDLSHRMRRFASDILSARDIRFRFRAPDDGKDFRLSTDLRREVYLIFKETVNNMAKHSECTIADLSFQIEGHWLTLKMSDNGKGFNVDAASNGHHNGMGGHGLGSMRRRAEALGGTYVIESEKGKGTTVTLRVPLSGRPKIAFLKRLLPK